MNTKSLKTIVICWVVSFSSYGQTNIDSLNILLSKSSDIQQIEVLVEIAKAYRTTSPDSVSKYGKRALVLSKKSNNSIGLAKSYWVLGLANSLVSKYDSSLFYFHKALNLLPENSDKILEADIYLGMGGVYYYNSELDKAGEMFIYAANIYEQLKEEKKLAPAYSNIGIIMNFNNQDEQAKRYFLKSLKLADNYNLIGTKLPVLVNLGTLYNKQEKYDSAIYYADACYQISKTNNMTYGMAKALMILSESYSSLELFQQGLKMAKEGASLFAKMDNQRALRSMLYHKAVAFKGLGRNQEALDLSLKLLNENESKGTLNEFIYLLIHEIYITTGNFEKALEYYKLYFEDYKAYTTKESEKIVAELEAKYDTGKKSREIQSLTDKAKIRELTILQQNWMIGGAVLFFSVLVLILIIFYRQRNLKKHNEMLSLQQKFLRLQMNPHFIFNALGAIQKFVVKNDPIQGATFIARFSSLMRQVLEHSRENYITLEEEVDTLTNYLELQKLRFEDKFDYYIQVGAELNKEEIEIPPMFAQPFIENSLEHGISSLQGKGKIEVIFEKAGSNVKLIIKDNGVGLKDVSIVNNGHKSLASTITKERIQALIVNFDKQDKLTIVNLLNKDGKIVGTQVSMLLPIK